MFSMFYSFLLFNCLNKANDIIESLWIKHGLQFWRYNLNVSYFLDSLFLDFLVEKFYRALPAIKYASANDFLTLSILLAQQSEKKAQC